MDSTDPFRLCTKLFAARAWPHQKKASPRVFPDCWRARCHLCDDTCTGCEGGVEQTSPISDDSGHAVSFAGVARNSKCIPIDSMFRLHLSQLRLPPFQVQSLRELVLAMVQDGDVPVLDVEPAEVVDGRLCVPQILVHDESCAFCVLLVAAAWNSCRKWQTGSSLCTHCKRNHCILMHRVPIDTNTHAQ